MPFALQAILWGVVTLSVVVFLHEGGHFLAARAFGVRVHEFMLGLPGPKLSFKRGDTRYGVTMIPFGGYTKIAGMDGDIHNPHLKAVLTAVTSADCALTAADVAQLCDISEDEAALVLGTLVDWFALTYDEKDTTWRSVFAPELADNPDALFSRAQERTYLALPFWKRAVVLLNGIIINIIFALIVFTVVLSVWGPVVYNGKVDPVAKGPAAVAGMKAGDVITKVNATSVSSFTDITQALKNLHPGDTVTLSYRRPSGGEAGAARAGQAKVLLGHNPQDSSVGYLGIEAVPEHEPLPVPRAAGQSFTYVKLTVQGILGFFTPGKFRQSVNNSASIVGISVIAAQVARTSALDYAQLVAAISLSLGLMNLLPIPPLDGGKVLIEAFEAIRRKPLSLKVNAALSAAGLGLLVVFMIYVMSHDILRLFK